MKEDLLQLALKFIHGEIDEITYISRHDRDWYEVKELAATDPITFGILLRKLSLPYRRKALIHAFSLRTAELKTLLLGDFSESSSTIFDLTNPLKSRRFSNELLAQFGIIHRVPFDWAYKDRLVMERWNFKNYDFSGIALTCMKDLIPLLRMAEDRNRDVKGYVIQTNTDQECYIRLESRTDVIVVDLYQNDLLSLDKLMSALKSRSLTWSGFITQSVVPGHRYWTFIGAENESAIARVLESEFKYIQNDMRL
ncbi:hypothetical protein KDJ56_14870 [Brevibacillus composti]|uniref:Uncharacterized protein n=1 Tax=Brevibacillus composti TaxID=2796470 RepID=A0A7T5EIJ0_9BACL|nr:hypothetical protein [Brevibacillus composti]QQE73193.1 hypothetical protein JD108_14925 [Brevibacillus composti]QUO40274.1 hypothetical protein KDJ56_14870 [Brevibacillus composti]